ATGIGPAATSCPCPSRRGTRPGRRLIAWLGRLEDQHAGDLPRIAGGRAGGGRGAPDDPFPVTSAGALPAHIRESRQRSVNGSVLNSGLIARFVRHTSARSALPPICFGHIDRGVPLKDSAGPDVNRPFGRDWSAQGSPLHRNRNGLNVRAAGFAE